MGGARRWRRSKEGGDLEARRRDLLLEGKKEGRSGASLGAVGEARALRTRRTRTWTPVVACISLKGGNSELTAAAVFRRESGEVQDVSGGSKVS